MDELPGGILRVTTPLPTRPGHVHSYLLPGEDGWTLVDTGLGLPDARERWQAELRGLSAPVARIFVTHFHPDHVGAGAVLRELTGAPVLQGSLDLAQSRLVWGGDDWAEVLTTWFHTHGVPAEVTDELLAQGGFYSQFIQLAGDETAVEAGDRVDGWELAAAPGHADGQLVLVREGVLVAADHLLGRISPTVGLWPRSRPDPLGDYLESLRQTIELAPQLALPGHGAVVENPVARAWELIEHHRERLDVTSALLSAEPRSAYDVSFPLFGDDLKPAARRFAVAEALSHLERLAREGRATRHEADGVVSYTGR